MNKEDYIKIEEINQRGKSNTKRLDDHDCKLDKLENVYIALTKMDSRVERVEGDVGEIKTNIKIISDKTNEPNKLKALKWEKLIDYLFYAFLGFCLWKLGMK